MMEDNATRTSNLTFDLIWKEFRDEGYRDDANPVCTPWSIAKSLPSAVQGNTQALDTQMKYLYSLNQVDSKVPTIRIELANTFFSLDDE